MRSALLCLTKRFLFLFLLTAFTSSITATDLFAQTTADSIKTVAYINGNIWTGENFVERTLYVRGGYFVEKPSKVDTTIDLAGGYVIPPFGGAHTHMLGWGRPRSIHLAYEFFLESGIFYALDATNPYSKIREVREYFKKDTTLDVAFTLGGITSTGSHPAQAMESFFGDDNDTTWTLAGNAYWFMDSMADVKEKWPEYIAQKPDIVKVYLMDVKEGLKEGDMTGHGLRPKVLRAIVERAHKAGVRVMAHIRTNADFRLAVDAGVDIIAHMLDYECRPGQNKKEYQLSAETIRHAAKQDVIVETTVWTQVEDLHPILFPDQLRCAIQLYRETARRLHKAGIRLAIGADDWKYTSLHEAILLYNWNFFDSETLLNLWTRTTPRVIFPKRKIGRLVEGYEASFLVLGSNPIDNFVQAVTDIRFYVKQGHKLVIPED